MEHRISNDNNAPHASAANPQFEKLKSHLLENYPISETSLNSIQEVYSFEMNFNSITAEDILYHFEAKVFNLKDSNQKESNPPPTEDMIITLLKESLSDISKSNKPKKKKIGAFGGTGVSCPSGNSNSMTNTTLNIQIISDTSKQISIESSVFFNENNHTSAQYFNSCDISYSFFSNFEIKEYSLIPKDEYSFYDEYKSYFRDVRNQMQKALNIAEDDPLLGINKFILIVTFDSTEGKPLLTEIVLVDPMKDYQRYFLKFENESCLKDYYFFSGQILYVEGYLKSNEIFVNKFFPGFPLISYSVSDSYVRQYFTESAPYLIYALNGPIFNKTDTDLSVFIQSLNHIANENPHALILSGPLIHTDNSVIMSGELGLTLEENSMNYFEFFELILQKINEIFAAKRTTIILVPSPGDVISYYPLPQPSYNFSYLKNVHNMEIAKKGRLKLIGNPQIFQLNEIIFGIANFDVVKEMISNSLRSQLKHPIDASLEMILQQKSFFPVLSNTVNIEDNDKMDKTICVDYRKMNHFSMDMPPDVLITSSAMNQFVKKINSTICINPGSLFKNNNTGCFAKIISYPPNTFIGNEVIGRLRVELCRVISNKKDGN